MIRMWMCRRRRRKMMMMLRRKTNPKTGKHTLCEPAKSKHTWTFHKSHFVWEIFRTNAGPHSRDTRFVRACSNETHMDISQEPFYVGNFQEKCRTPLPRHAFCASPRSRNAHGHFTRAICVGNFQDKCRTPLPRHTFCASLLERNVHGHFTRAILCGKFSGQMPDPTPATHVLCEPAQSNMDVSQEPF